MNSRVERLKKRLLESNPCLDVERAVLFTRAFRDNEDKPTVVKYAKAMEKILGETSVKIHPEELIVGDIASRLRAAHIFPEATGGWLEQELDLLSQRPWDPLGVTEEEKLLLREEVFPYWKGKSIDERIFSIIPDDTKCICYDDPSKYPVMGTAILQNRNQTTTYVGNVNPNYEYVLKNGFVGIKEQASRGIRELDPTDVNNLKGINFLHSVLIVADAAINFSQRYSKEAGLLAEKESDPVKKGELLKIARICERVPAYPAESFHEALQCVWFIHVMTRLSMNGNAFALGRLDQYLYPYYEKDLKEGVLTKEQALELLECFYIKVASIIILRATADSKSFGGFAIWNLVTLGGQTQDGKDATNELSYMCLDAMEEMRLPQPDLCIRVHSQTPQEYVVRAAKLGRLGLGHPKFQSDESIIPYMMLRGVTEEEARNYVLTACVEARPEKEGNYLTAVYLNLAAAIEAVFTNGVLRYNGRKVGVETGRLEDIKTWEDFVSAYDQQIRHFCRHGAISCACSDLVKREVLAAPFLSSMRPDCLERARDLYSDGAVYNDGGGYWSAIGVADTIDSLMAVKKLVFEDNAVSLQELAVAIQSNFDGREQLRQMLMNVPPKYGNDNDEVDVIAKQVIGNFAREVYKYRNGLGAKYQPEVTTLTVNIPFGTVVGALPNGRRAGQPLTDGVSPSPGNDRRGAAMAMKSVGKLTFPEPDLIFGYLYNMKFSPLLLKTNSEIEKFASLLRTYLVGLKGWHLQFNVIDSNVLKDAQKHPENYPYLLVKVAGYSAYFKELDKSVQDEIIQRTEYACF